MNLETIIRRNYRFDQAEELLTLLKSFNAVEFIEEAIEQHLYDVGELTRDKTFEEIVEEIDKRYNPYLCQVYHTLTAREYFEEYEGSTDQAERDVLKAYEKEFGKGIITVNNLEELVEEHLANVDQVARRKQDWGV